MEFPALIRKYREDAGFDSARAFYNGLGGRGFFGCTYKQFLNVESGRSVAQPPLVEKLAAGLRVAVDERRGREFAMSYLAAILGRRELVALIASALSGALPAPAGGGSPMRRAMTRSFSERSEPLTREQSDLLISDLPTYWSFTILANDRGSLETSALAAATGLPPAKIKASLARLQKARLVDRGTDGRWSFPKAGRVFLHPRDEVFVPKVVPALKRLWEEMASKRGAVLLNQHLFTRASEAELRAYFPYMAQSVQGADIYSTMDKGPDTAFFLVETLVRRILPF